MERAFELMLNEDDGFDATRWVRKLEVAVLSTVQRSSKPLKYAEIGLALGLNETSLSNIKFKNAVIMVVVEDLVDKGYLRVPETIGWPYVESAM